jgi:predicted alpha/beta-fold hydrolase
MGAGILTKYLGEEGKDPMLIEIAKSGCVFIRLKGALTPLAAAITLANPLDYIEVDKQLKRPFHKLIYNFGQSGAAIGNDSSAIVLTVPMV